MVITTLSEHISSKQSPARLAATASTDRILLLLLLEKIVTLIEMTWHEELNTKRVEGADTPRQAVLRKAHHALGEWFELETLRLEAEMGRPLTDGEFIAIAQRTGVGI